MVKGVGLYAVDGCGGVSARGLLGPSFWSKKSSVPPLGRVLGSCSSCPIDVCSEDRFLIAKKGLERSCVDSTCASQYR